MSTPAAASAGIDPDVAALFTGGRAVGTRPLHELGVEHARTALERAPRSPAPAMRSVEDLEFTGPHGPVAVRVYRPTTDSGTGGKSPAIVYFHGGGMVMGTIDSFDSVARHLAHESAAVVVSVDYRLAPEYPYPVATDEAWAATCWVQSHAAELAVDPAAIAVAGDSAGGSLAAGVALRARDEASLELVAQLLFYPGLERPEDRPSMLEFADGPILTRRDIVWMKNQYLGPDPSRDTVYGVPALAADLHDLPDAVVVSAQFDPLRDGVEAYGERLRDAGVPTALLRYPGVCHGFLSQTGRTRRAGIAMAEIGALVRQKFATRSKELR